MILAVLTIGLLALAIYYPLRHRIDDILQQIHLSRLARRMATEFPPEVLLFQLWQQYSHFSASVGPSGWTVSVQIPESDGANTWPPFVHRIDTLRRRRLFEKEVPRSSRNGFDQDWYDKLASCWTGDIGRVAQELLNRTVDPIDATN